MEKKTDLRIIKTKKRIKQVFCDLLEKKELRRITVTELAKTAEINKGTFYLHYKDIYELYTEVIRERICDCVGEMTFFEEFFEEPEAFLFHFFAESEKNNCERGTSFFRNSEEETALFTELLCKALTEKIYTLGRIERTDENDIRLEYIIMNLLHVLRSGEPERKYPILSALIVSEIRTAFPVGVCRNQECESEVSGIKPSPDDIAAKGRNLY